MHAFIESVDLEITEIVRLGKLPSILSKYESGQDELQCLDEANYSLESFKISITKSRQSSKNFYILWLTHHCRDTTYHVAGCQDTIIILHGHTLAGHILRNLSLHYQHLKVTHVAGYTSETHLRHCC
jgi:hypothetical protein